MSETPKKHKTKRRSRLTDREKKFLAARVKGLSLQDAALEAGYSERNPATSATRAMQQIENKAPDIFAEVGLDDCAFVKKCVIPALFATERRVFNHNGKLIYSKAMIAWGPRTTTNALVAKMKGLIKEEQPQATGPVIKSVIINGAYRPPIQLPQTNGHEPKQIEVGPPPLLSPGGLGDPGNGNGNGQP